MMIRSLLTVNIVNVRRRSEGTCVLSSSGPEAPRGWFVVVFPRSDRGLWFVAVYRVGVFLQSSAATLAFRCLGSGHLSSGDRPQPN